MATTAAWADGAGMVIGSRALLLLAAIAAVAALPACRVPDTPTTDVEALADFVPPLEVGRTTRADVLLALGAPVERFENDRILCWRIARTGSGQKPMSVYVSPWYGTDFATALSRSRVDPRVRIESSTERSLVLVFDGSGVLQRARALRQP
jgi:hypothetical protein